MPRGSRQSSRGRMWENQNNNIPNMRSGISDERRRLLEDRGIIERQEIENDNNFTFQSEEFERLLSEMARVQPIRTIPSPTITARGRRGETITTYIPTTQTISYDLAYTQPQYKYIHSYDYKPSKFNFNKIFNTVNTEPYLGFELEVDKGGKIDENAKTVIDIVGEENVYCKHDGSLSNGFEIVTHPATLDYHCNTNYNEMMDKLIELDYKSHDTKTCGLHIHFNKNYFGEDKTIQDLCITKLLYLFEKYWDNIVEISRRSNSQYAQRYYMYKNESMFDVLSKAKNSCSKYHAINLKNTTTVEIRTFKGTLKYNTLIATLQFVNRIVKLCKDTELLEIQNVAWENIIENPEKELEQYLIERGILEKKLEKSA